MTAYTSPGSPDGTQSALAVNAAGVIVAHPCRLFRITVLSSPGTQAQFCDAATTGAASSSNAILNVPALAGIGSIYELCWPCLNGLTLSAAGGGSFSVSLG